MKKRSLIGILSLLILVSLLLSGCGGTGKDGSPASKDTKQIVLRYAFFAPATTFPAKQMEKWKEGLEMRTNNKVKVELFHGGALLTDKNMYDGVKSGVADIGLSCPTYEPGRFPLMAISDLPSGFPNSKVASRVIYDLVQEYPPDAFKDYKIITVFATEPSHLMVVKPVSSLQDLKGRKIRISGALTPVLKELGASPVGMSMSEVQEALQTGVVEGMVSSRDILKDLKLAEKLKYTTDYPLTVTSFAAVMNKDVWNSLPPDVQKVIDELSLEMAIWTGEYMDNHVKEALEWSKKEHGLQITSLTAPEKESWTRMLQPVQDKYVADLQAKGLPAEDYKKRLYELIEKYNKQ